MVVASVFFILVVLAGTGGYHYLGDGRWELFDCFYMTVVTLSTVGFAETLPGIERVYGARSFTLLLIVLGSGTLLYFVSTLTAFVVEGDLVGALRRNRMHKRISALENHVIVCGAGSTGVHVVEELATTRTPFVVVDLDESRLLRLAENVPRELLYVVGDATDDHTLEQASIGKASGLIAALHDDKDNIFATITARALNSSAKIIAKAVETTADAKLRRAGADAVVSPNRIGGMRMVSEMIRPQVVEFLELMLRTKEQALRIEEVPIPPGSSLDGMELKDTEIRKVTNVLVIAVRTPEGTFVYNPGPATALKENMTLIVLGETDEVIHLRRSIEQGTLGTA
jgi:voltage-gated potassium channel